MTTLFWLFYALLFIGALVIFLLNSFQSAAERITIPQLLYAMYLLVFFLLCTWLKSAFAGVACLAVFLGMILWIVLQPGDSAKARRDDLEAELADYREALKASPENAATLNLIGHAYDKIGEAALARKYFDKALALFKDPAVVARLRAQHSHAPVPVEFLRPLRACPACERIAFRSQYACLCGQTFYPGILTWFMCRFNGFFDDNRLTQVTAAGLALLPYLYRGGPLPYGVLWGMWAAALFTWKS